MTPFGCEVGSEEPFPTGSRLQPGGTGGQRGAPPRRCGRLVRMETSYPTRDLAVARDRASRAREKYLSLSSRIDAARRACNPILARWLEEQLVEAEIQLCHSERQLERLEAEGRTR